MRSAGELDGGRSAVIVGAVRTPIGTAGGVFAGVDVATLAAAPIATLADLGDVGSVVLGNCMGPGGNLARVSALAAGLPVSTPGLTIDQQCGSGLAAVAQAAAMVHSGRAELVLAGGAESASTAPARRHPGSDAAYARAPMAPPAFPDPEMGAAADDLAARLGIDRATQDQYAARSHELAALAVQVGTFDEEIVGVHGVTRDQRPRSGLGVHRLARLRPAFSPGGTATAGNSCGISDGAALVAVGSGESAGLLIVDDLTIGCDPALPGLGAGEAIAELLRRNRIGPDDIGAAEITEAFASVAIAAIARTGLDRDIVCSDGGAIGLGHPWGASGALLLVRLFSRMVRADGPELGVAACAVGGGLGIAMLVRRQ